MPARPSLSRRASVRILGAALMGTGLLGTGLTSAGITPALAQDAAAVVRNGANRILEVLKAGASDADRRATLSQVMRQSFDLPAVGRNVLGRHWSAATPAQQQAFLAAFEKTEVKAYAERFKAYSGQTFDVGKVSANGPSQMVESRITQPNASQPIRVTWEVQHGKIVDVIIEGVSMAATRRSDFNAYIQRNGIDGLIKELERRGA